MVYLYDSRTVIRKFHFEQNQQYPDLKKTTSPKFHHEFLSNTGSDVSPHLFVVDWQIPESEESNYRQDYLSA